jgi:ribosomal protein S3AE
MQLTKNDALNLIDALNEWYEIVEPKELEENEIGLNYERFQNIMLKLELIGK